MAHDCCHVEQYAEALPHVFNCIWHTHSSSINNDSTMIIKTIGIRYGLNFSEVCSSIKCKTGKSSLLRT